MTLAHYGILNLWDEVTGALLQTLDVTFGRSQYSSSSFKRITCFSPLPKGGYAINCCDDKLRTWDQCTGEFSDPLICFGPGDNVLVLSSGGLLLESDADRLHTARIDSPSETEGFSSDHSEQTIDAADKVDDDSIRKTAVFYYDYIKGTLQRLYISSLEVNCKAAMSSMNCAAVHSNDHSIQLYRIEDGNCHKVERFDCDDNVDTLTFSPDGKHLIVERFSSTVLWTLQANAPRMMERIERAQKCALSPNSRLLASVDHSSTITVRTVLLEAQPKEKMSDKAGGLFLSPSRERILTGPEYEKESSNVFDITRQAPELKVTLDWYRGGDVNFSRDGSWLTTPSHNNFMYVLDLQSGIRVRIMDDSYPDRLELSCDGKLLAATTNHMSKSLRIWTVNTQSLLWTPKTSLRSDFDVESMVFSPDSSLLAVRSSKQTLEGLLTVWDFITDRIVLETSDVSESSRAIAFSGDGRLLIYQSQSERLIFWSLVDGGPRNTSAKLSEGMCAATFSNNDKMLVTVFYLETAVWNVDSGSQIRSVKPSFFFPRNLSFSDDGTHVMCEQGELQVFPNAENEHRTYWRCFDG